ncbi:MAG: ADOP family duplicated permease [Gemmatimonas sp.]
MSKHKSKDVLRGATRTQSGIARDIDEELSFHLDMRTRELVHEGMDEQAARTRAQKEFGDVDFTRRYCASMDAQTERRERSATVIAEFLHDVRYAFRTLRRSKGFAAVSLFTLALAIGANTALFSVARAVLFKPLPYGNPERVVQLQDHPVGDATETYSLAPANFVDIRQQQVSFADLAAFSGFTPTLQREGADPEIIRGAQVTPDIFRTLAVPAQHGRTFSASDTTSATAKQTILSHALWERVFGSDATIVGRSITLDGERYTVAGIMPPHFALGIDDQLWVPYRVSEPLADMVRARRQHYLRVVGRLKAGVTLEQARTEIATVSQRLAAQYPEANAGTLTTVRSMRDVLSGAYSKPLLLLQCAAFAVLLIACANLANLTLSRSVARSREMAVRAALGAGRFRLIRQLTTESLVLSIAGGATGALLAGVLMRRLLAINPEALKTMYNAGLDAWVFTFSLVISVATGLLFGLAPAIGASRTNLSDALKQGGRGSSGGRSRDVASRVLVVTQTALAVTLLVTAGLLMRSFGALTNTSLGYSTDHILTAQLQTTGARYDSASAVNQFYSSVLEQIAATPGVTAVGGATVLPTRGRLSTKLRVVGEPTDESNLPDLGYQAVRGDYFKALQIPVVQGRLYDATDDTSPEEAVIINETAARRFFPRNDAIGRQIRIGPDQNSPPLRIIGVVGDTRDQSVDMPAKPTMFASHTRETWDPTLNVVIRTTGNPESVASAVRAAVRQHDATLAVRDIRSFEDVIGASLAPRRFALGLAGTFATVAILLAAIGIYGVLAYSVSVRTRDFGVRMALGASSRTVLAMVLKDGLLWSSIGLVLGLGVAMGLGRLLSGMLYGVGAHDPLTYVVVALGQLAVVVAACTLPALRATRVDPLTSMRAD